MKTNNNFKLNEVKILQRLQKGQMKNIKGGVKDKLLACGDMPTHRACNVCQA